jgi:hypothetical protein
MAVTGNLEHACVGNQHDDDVHFLLEINLIILISDLDLEEE